MNAKNQSIRNIRLFAHATCVSMVLFLFSGNQAYSQEAHELKERFGRSIAKIIVEVRNADGKVVDAPSGTGFLVSTDGHFLTAAHVLSSSLDGSGGTYRKSFFAQFRDYSTDKLPLDLIGEPDLVLDIAVLRLTVLRNSVVPCLSTQLQAMVGVTVTAFGYPGDQPLIPATGGIASPLGSSGRWLATLPASRGHSGGPVFDSRGTIVGMVRAGHIQNPALVELIPAHYLSGYLARFGLPTHAGGECENRSGKRTDPQVSGTRPQSRITSTPEDACHTVSVASASGKHCVKPGSSQSFRDCPQCPELVAIPSIPPGPIEPVKILGNGRALNEQYAQLVRVEIPFAIGQFEVTFDEWVFCMSDRQNGCGDRLPNDHGWGRGRQPVVDVSLDDAQKFANWLSATTRETYRLPTEAEWQHAARAGGVGAYYFGDDQGELCKHANSADRREIEVRHRNQKCDDPYQKRSAPVGHFEPNSYGLYDALGNIAEWVADCWKETPILSQLNAVHILRKRNQPCQYGTIRGGHFRNGPLASTPEYREVARASIRSSMIGFRILREFNRPAAHQPAKH